MAAFLPLNGAATDHYTTRFLSKSFGFAMGWNICYAFAILVPFEITASVLIIHYWAPPVHDAVFISILLVIIVGLNYLPARNSGEAEFAFSSLKLGLLAGLIILSVVLAAGGGPSGDALGFRYWHDPGPANPWIVEGGTGIFVSFVGVIVSVVLPVSSPASSSRYLSATRTDRACRQLTFAVEMVATCSGETTEPQKVIPKAARAFAIRLVVFYVLPILGVTLICSSDAAELISGGAGAGSSPFVIGIKNAGIRVLDHIVNVIILCSAWSAGNVFMFLASRSLYSLAASGNAPRIFTRTSNKGVPYWAVTGCTVLTLLAYLNVSSSSGVVFNWLVNMINMAAFFSWITTSFAYLRFRRALEVQGVDRSTLTYVSVCGKPGAYLCIAFFSVVGLLNGFYVFFPSEWNVSDFLTAYIGTVLFVVLYVGHKMTVGRKHPWVIPAEEIDLLSEPSDGIAAEVQVDVERAGSSPGWKGILKRSKYVG